MDDDDDDLTVADSVVLSAGMIGFGIAFVYGVYLMKMFRWVSREFGAARAESLPAPGTMHMRMYALRRSDNPLPRTIDFPDNIIPITVNLTADATSLLTALNAEQTPVLAVGPGGGVFRLSHRLPIHRAYAGVYGANVSDDKVSDRVRDIERRIAEAGFAGEVLYAVPDVHALTDKVSFPFAVDGDFRKAITRLARDFEVLCFHTEAAWGCGQ